MPRVAEERNPIAPEPGFFKVRLVKRGVWVAAKIGVADAEWSLTIDGEPYGCSADPWKVQNMDTVWFFGPRIDESEYHYLLAVTDWAKRASPKHPAANPRRPIDLASAPSLF